jgi:LacI family transcriptional regulator
MVKTSKSATIKEVAAKANISLATASRVLSGTGYASRETRMKVLKAAQELGYTPNELARNLKRNRTDTVGLMITDIVNPFYSYLADGVLDCARKNGFHVILCATDEDPKLEEEYLRVLIKQRAAGIIAVPTGENVEIYCQAYKMGVNLVLVDRELPGVEEADIFLVDNVKGAQEAIQYLIQLGHRRIGIINGPLTTTTGQGRLEGYKRAINGANIEIDDELIEIVTFKGESGFVAARKLLTLTNPPTAIFATNNVLGEATLHVIREMNLRIPQDISLIIFDDVPWTSLVNPSITVVSQPTYELGYLGMELIGQKIRNKDLNLKIPRRSILSPKLIIRNSCMQV